MRKNGKPSSRSANGHKKDISKIMREGTAIDRAVRRATREAVLMHKKLGQPIVVWRNGKVVWLKPHEIK